jgi:hypothetical protein
MVLPSETNEGCLKIPAMNETTNNSRGSFRRILGWLAILLLGFLLIAMTLWAAAALYFDVRVSWLRVPMAAAYLLGVAAIWIFLPVPAASSRRLPIPRWLVKPVVTLGVFLLVLAWWLSLQPSNDRDWQPDVALLPYAEITGNQAVVHNIRNCSYRTEHDFDVHYYDKTVNLDELRTADLFLVTWGSPHIAHTMVSFGFEGGDHVCFSIETRKEKGEGYSAVKGLFRQFELTYIIGDERDLVRLRTNYRQGEEASLYHLRITPAQARTLFLDYLGRVNSLRNKPEWYNALTDNCTTGIRAQRAAAERDPWDWRMLINGHLDELLYQRGTIATNLPFAELRQRSHINARAKSADQSANFSLSIRQDLPDPTP